MTAESPVQYRLVTRYTAASVDAADENQRRIEHVFAALAETKPDNVTYIVLRLGDNSFVHLPFHGHGHDDPNPITGLPAFKHFGDDHAARRHGAVDQQEAQLIGAYITTIA
jgi:hypothetical protein